jgi:hypothetical protein
MIVFWDIAPCRTVEMTGMLIASITIALTSETSVNFYETTQRNIREDSHLQLYTLHEILLGQSN